MGKAWDRVPGSDLPTVFPQRNARDGAYRLLANPGVRMDDILQPHREAVAERCALETTVLLVRANRARQRQVLLAKGHQQHLRALEPLVRERIVRIGARRAGQGAGGAGERAGAARGPQAAGLAAAVERWAGHGRGRPARGGALRAALADRGILQGAQVRHEAAGPAAARGGQHRELPSVQGSQRVEGVRHHALGARSGRRFRPASRSRRWRSKC